MRTLRSKLILLLVISALTPLLIFGALSLYNFQKALRASIEESYQEIATRSAEEIGLFLNHARDLLETLVQDLAETNLTPQQSERIIENYVIRFPQFLKIMVYENGNRVFSTSLKQSEQDFPDPSLVEKSAQGEFVTSSPYLSEDLTPVLWFLVPMPSQSATKQVMVAQVDLMQMWRWVGETRLGKQGYSCVVDEAGTVIAAGNPKLKETILSSEQPVYFQPFSPQDISSRPRVVSTLRGERLMSVRQISENPRWYLILSQPTKEAFAAIRSTTLALVVLVFSFLVLMIGTAIWGSRRTLLKPVRKLMRATEAIGQGDLTYQIQGLGQDELGKLGRSFNQMIRDLAEFQNLIRRQERVAMFGRMASGLAHDLKHPVKNIEHAAKLMETMHEDESYRQTFTRVVKREFSRINQFLEDLRNLTHEMPYHPRSFDLVDLLNEVRESFQGAAQEKQITLKLETAAPSLQTWGDPNLLRRVFENIISNAIQAIQKSAGSVLVQAEIQKKTFLVKIQDTGPGIPPERLKGLFEEFTTTKQKGLGLGLAISKKIMDLHQGEITVESRLGVGTTFYLKWPGGNG